MKMSQIIVKYLEAKRLEDRAKSLQSELKGVIFKGFSDRKIKSKRFVLDDGRSANVTIYEQEQSEYSFDILAEILDEEVLDDMTEVKVDCTLPIKEFRRLMKILCPTKTERKLLISILNPQKRISKDAVQKAFEIGEISIDDIRKARVVSKSTNVVKITASKDDQDE